MSPLDYRWEHAVNSFDLLRKVRQQIDAARAHQFRDADYVNAIEADIIWSESKQRPVMGHPPQTDSDLTLQAFLEEMAALTGIFQDAALHGATLGATPLIVKLDFKSAEAFEASRDLLRGYINGFPFPRGVFVNADILVGPANTDQVLFNASEFLQQAAALGSSPNEDKIVLSVGWTTSNATEEEFHRPYTHAMVDEMLAVLQPYQHLHVTFPLRATSCRASWDVIKRLLTGPPTYGFTLWWAKTRMENAEIQWLYSQLELDNGKQFANRTFYDILGFDEAITSGQSNSA